MIEVEQLVRRYGERTAVERISFRVERGEIVGVLGPNGAGKSTTLKMITGFLAPTGGRIRVDGIDASENPVEARKRIGYMPENVPLYPEMRVREYLRYRAELKRVPRRSLKSAVERSLELAGVADARDRIIGQLSKGYRQRVGLADALVADPPLLILDEPTAGLDPNQIRQVRDLVRGFAGEKTVLLSTHILPEVEATCSRVLILHRGKLVGEGAPDKLRSFDDRQATVALVGRGAPDRFREVLGGVEGVTTVEDIHEVGTSGGEPLVRIRVHTNGAPETAEAIFRAVANGRLVLRELVQEAASLEDVFTQLTTQDAASDAVDSSASSDATKEAQP